MAKKQGKTVVLLGSLVFLMGSASFLSVPFYNWFCKVTGYGGTPTISKVDSTVVLDNKISVRFDVSLERGLAWQIKPQEREIVMNLGQTGLAFYEAFNPTDRPIAAQASFNVVPFSMGSYFNKIECFCFTEQVLMPGERIEMPVSFYVDPEMVENIEARNVKSVTLSYTFYEIDLPDSSVKLEKVSGKNVNIF